MGVKPRPLRQSGLHFGVLVGAVVIDDQVQIEFLGHLFDDPSQTAEELLVAGAWAANRVVVPWRM